ncbi:MAG: hypothetical protein WAN87_00280 [Thermoplasmata archaeon]
MQPAPNAAARRFRRVWTVSLVVKLAALMGLLVFIAIYLGSR